MRAVPIIALTISAGLAAGGAGMLGVGARHSSDFAARADSLSQTWARDLAEGVPAASIDPLRARLQQQRPPLDWWSPSWWAGSDTGLLDDLQRQTDAAWAAAMSAARNAGQLVLDAWHQEVDQNRQYVPAAEVATAQAWPGQLAGASTPNAVAALIKPWQLQLDTTRAEVGAALAAAQAKAQATAQLAAQLQSVGGPQGLLAKAGNDVRTARQDNLDTGPVPTLSSTLQGDINSGTPAAQTAAVLLVAVQQLEKLIGLNNQIATAIRPLYLGIVQAEAEATPNAGTLMSTYGVAQAAFTSGTTFDQLSAVQQQVSGLQTNLDQELAAHRCGHNVGAGKVITISLSLQEGVYYQDGCVANASPVTTGRPQLRTPAGNFRVFYKTSPFIFHSAWPPGSPFWYPDSLVSWVMEFAAGGYYLHDAWWESSGQYGPGGQNGGGASHGCIHIPTPTMQWLYSWTPVGTPVLISN